MPIYALRLQREGIPDESHLWDSGGREPYLHDIIDFAGERWEVVQIEGRSLDTPGGREVVAELVCVPA